MTVCRRDKEKKLRKEDYSENRTMKTDEAYQTYRFLFIVIEFINYENLNE